MQYLQVTIKTPGRESTDLLVALLAEEGFEGFEEKPGELRAFIPVDNFDEHAFDQLASGHGFEFKKDIIEQKNWNAVWESNFSPVDIPYRNVEKVFLHIRAGFHAPGNSADHEIVITPKMSFGTGHHATTFLMAQAMSEIDFSHKSVIDFGTGTGILAILAEKLGADNIYAVDNDDWCIENSVENIATNSCENILLEKGSHIKGREQADIILANINLNVILNNLKDIRAACKTHAIVLFSGLLQSDEDKIKPAIIAEGLNIKQISYKDGWMLIESFL